MHMNPVASIESPWSAASRKRRFLAAYLDYLFFGAPWTVAIWALAALWPALQQFSFSLNILLFLVFEALLVTVVKWSPGQYCLGIVSRQHISFASLPDFRGPTPTYLVDRWLYTHERWWTLLFGVLAVLDGAKSLARWTFWQAPFPFLGTHPSAEASIAVQLFVGAAEVTVGITVLRLKWAALPLGLVVYGLLFVSTLLSWQLLPGWIEEHVVARRSLQGRSPRPGEIAFMQTFVPVGTVFAAGVATAWLALIGRRAQQAASVLARGLG